MSGICKSQLCCCAQCLWGSRSESCASMEGRLPVRATHTEEGSELTGSNLPLEMAGHKAGPGTSVPTLSPALSNMPGLFEPLPVQSLCLSSHSLGPPTPHHPSTDPPHPLSHSPCQGISQFFAFLGLETRERSLPGGPLW